MSTEEYIGTLSDYKILAVENEEGASATVYKAEKQGQPYALKIFNKDFISLP